MERHPTKGTEVYMCDRGRAVRGIIGIIEPGLRIAITKEPKTTGTTRDDGR